MAEQNATNTTTTAIGEVQAVTGRVIAIGADGVERQLFAGDPVFADDQIKTIGEGTIVVALKDGSRFDLGRDSEALLDEAVYSDDVAAVKEAALADIEEIQRMILEGADPTEITEEPAAGGDQGSAGESVQEAVGLDRTGRVGVVEAGYETRGLEQSIDPLVFDRDDFETADEAGTTTGGVAPLTLTVSAPDNSSDSTPTISGVTNAPVDSTVSLVVTDSAGDVQNLFATVQPDGSYSVEVPFALPEGDYMVDASVMDDEGNTASASDPGSVNAVNDVPVANVDSVTLNEDAAATVIDVLANDTDLEGDTLSVDSVTQPANGTVTLIGGVVSYDPGSAYDYLAVGETATDTFSYTLSDGQGGTDTATVTVTITGTNDAPVAVADINSGFEDGTITGSVAVNDSDSDNAAVLSYSLDAPVAGLSFSPDGSYSLDASHAAYQSLAEGEILTLVANYTVTDDKGATDTSTLTITLTGTNDLPVVVDNVENIDYLEGAGPVTLFPTASLSDIDNATLESLTVTIDGVVPGQDLLSADVSGTGISASYDASSGVLTLSGTDTLANYQAVLQSVSYDNSSDDAYTTPRTLQIVANDGVEPSVVNADSLSTLTVATRPTISIDDVSVKEPVGGDGGVALIAGEIVRNPADTDYSSVDQWVITHNGGDLEIDVWTDIDLGGNLDSYIVLYRMETDGSFTRIDRNNDAGGGEGTADGSTNKDDSYLSLTGLEAGSYLLAIGANSVNDDEATTTTQDYPNKEKEAGEYRITLTGDVEVPPLASQTYLRDPAGHANIVEDGVPRPDTVELTFTVTLDSAPTATTGPVSVDYQTSNGTAVAGAPNDGDYDSVSGTLTFDVGETVKTVTVLVNADDLTEADESFTLDLSNLSGNATYSADAHITGTGIQGIGSIYEEDQLEVGTETPVVGGSGNDVLAGDIGGVTILQAAVNAVYVVDVSGSMAWDAETGSSTITTQSRMDVVKDSLTRLNELYQNLTETGTPAVVTYITYSSSASISTTFDLAVEAEFAAAQQFLQDLVPGGGTNQGAAVDLLSDYLQTSGQVTGESDVYLLTDGYPSGYVSNALRANADLNDYLASLAAEDVPDINAIAIGNGVNPTDVDTYLDPIDNTENPDGTTGAQVVVDANDLPEVLLANFELAPVSNDTILGEAGNDIIFGDVINTDHLTGVEGLGYPGLVSHLAETLGHEPSQQEVLDYIVANHETLNQPGDTRGGDDLLDGGQGDDVLYGQGGMDTLRGDVGNDMLDGGEGNDILIGGSGDDILVGAGGLDVFVWEAGDQDNASDPALDVVKDFSLDDGDALNLADLLTGEDAGNLTDYLHFEQDGANAVVHVSSDGGFGGGYAAAAEDQTIILENVDISGLGSDQQIIDALIAGNNLITD